MNDIELLELAAKAAGIELAFDETNAELPLMPFDIKRGVYWNTLAYDGDALRLHVFCYQTYGTEYIERFNAAFEEQLYLNPSYATAGFRRATTTTAAEIGKAMP